MHKVFEENTQLKKAFVTSDDQAFYQENDAKNHAKTLDDKTVEAVYNETELNVVDEEVLTSEEEEMAAFELAEKAKKEADEKAVLVNEALMAFDAETTDYNSAVKLFGDLGLVSESKKKDVIYPILAAAKTAVQTQ
jgi:hypothetical protein